MSKIACILIGMFISSAGFTQGMGGLREAKQESSVEVGVNLAFLVFRMVNLNNGAVPPSFNTYALTLKKITNNNGFRMGFGFDHRVANPNSSSFFVPIRAENNFYIGRIGYERQINLLKRLQINTGVDLRTNFIKERTVNVGQFVLNREFKLGGGPFIGIEILLTDRLSISTEADLTYHHIINNREIDSFNGFNRKDKELGNEIKFNLPTTLYFTVKF